ncbi:hypothetical protein PPL_07880 [Heterostelium album PN500]|uniref:EF-hand domain-containing protein n=1 Tax=Heterostelium pallidum (strain ATCC 26659 / Pp 5 / PN500) TaxID=670386 RepID=D3BH78_HETP5|nr:hypothetical protein PPL_07880 [Heterostelium album PN500]EFA79462.1 hypothetical protein PPL_07880 [Heterostelium album PN500]|eukprot:XP_020431583.1 hypothetical protein PPL_07880 [Heterostelium album PN500]
MNYQHKDESNRIHNVVSEEQPTRIVSSNPNSISKAPLVHYGEKEGEFYEKKHMTGNAIEDEYYEDDNLPSGSGLHNQSHVNNDTTKPTLREEYIDNIREDRARENEILRQEIIKKREQDLEERYQRARATGLTPDHTKRRDLQQQPIDAKQQPMKAKDVSLYGLQAMIIKENNPNVSDEVILQRISKWQTEARTYLSEGQNQMAKELEEILVIETYFNRKELALLYREFTTFSKGSLYMSKLQFQSFITIFQESNALTDSLLSAIDENGDGDIAFPEYVYALSVMSRGSVKERLTLY